LFPQVRSNAVSEAFERMELGHIEFPQAPKKNPGA
jgi:hypothetical protein